MEHTSSFNPAISGFLVFIPAILCTHGGICNSEPWGREFESRREQGKNRLQFSRTIYYTPKYLFHNKNKLQSDKIQKYGIGGVMNSNPVAYLLVM